MTSSSSLSSPTCDIFCRVVDNYGDIGVTWRLARQLHSEHGLAVRLVVDDLASFRKLAPAIDPTQREQSLDGIVIIEWRNPADLASPAELVIEAFGCAELVIEAFGCAELVIEAFGCAELVIEAFGCELPEDYVIAMTQRAIKPVWINLEYLSAELWVDSHHLLPSPHPKYPLTKHFFFPGFSANTGGLIREVCVPDPQWAEADPKTDAVLQVFVFGYEFCPAEALLAAMVNQQQPVCCHVSEGKLSDKLKYWRENQAKNGLKSAPVLEFDVIPFVPQTAFDDLLRVHDVLFVRGEDSLVRALWAAKPFVWQIYPQSEGAHWVKLNAFLDFYCEGLSGAANQVLRELWRAWNAADDAAIAATWSAFRSHLTELRNHARNRAIDQSKLPDLASNLLSFYQKTAKL